MNARPASILLLALLVPLGGCMQDSASYTLPEKNHAITLIRNQAWPWQDTLDVDVAVARLPECEGSLSIKAVPLAADLLLYQAPDEYAEPIFILQAGTRSFAVSTQSCRVQEFPSPPADPGRRLGSFREKDGRFTFVPDGS
ncbi:MAG TPA: hypothetical protein PLX46_00775 [Thiobacillaceae bacterium]|nr:hypothetical protein [Thiobacillaceae bacterium]